MGNKNRQPEEVRGEKIDVCFRQVKRSDGRFAIELYTGERSLGCLMWIESTDGSMVRIGPHAIGLSPADLADKSFFAEEEAIGICKWLKNAYDTGEVKPLYWSKKRSA